MQNERFEPDGRYLAKISAGWKFSKKKCRMLSKTVSQNEELY
jgi:hypothetical protein